MAIKQRVLLAVTASGLLLGSGAFAQSAAPATASQPAAASEGLEEITVTAERRENTIQRSSVIVESYSAAALAGVSQPQDLTQLSPGIQIGAEGPNLQVYIRGVGDSADNSRSQGAVPFNIDGVYIPRGNAAETSFFDINRIEVLKGPQGTLYGRNASGGTVNIVTNSPDLTQTGGDFGVEVGNYNNVKVDGALNVALSSTFAIRGAFEVADRDGYTTTGGDDEKIRAGRIRALWEPNDDFSLLLNTDVGQVGGYGSGAVVLPTSGGNPWRSSTANPLPWFFLLGPTTAPYLTPNDSFLDSHIWGVSAELNWKLPFATLTVLPGYRVQKMEYVAYPLQFRYAEDLNDKQDTVEIRLSNQNDFAKWVVGYYFYDEKPKALSEPTLLSLGNAVNYDEQTRANAVFGQTTLSATDSLRFIAGVRYTQERNSGNYEIGTGALPLVPFIPAGAATQVAPITASRVNWKGGVEYDLAPQSMLFATAATGFKAGGYASTPSCGPEVYKPETLTAYELGSRNRFFGNTLQVNAEAFNWKYKNQQVSDVTLDNCGEDANLTFNVGSSTISGGDLDTLWQFTSADTAHLSVEYAQGKYSSFSFSQFGNGVYAPGGGSRCAANATGGGYYSIDCSGQQITRLPEWSGVGKYEHGFHLPIAAIPGDFAVSATANFASARWLDLSYLPTGRVPGYITENAELNYSTPDHKWTVTGYVDNISNRAVYTSGSAIGSPSPNGYSYYAAYVDPPRMFGVRVRTSF
jgi:iron complex outermembrane recepter protein